MTGVGASSQPAVILADFGTTYTKWTLLLRRPDGTSHIEPAVAKPSESERPLKDGGCEWNPRKFLDRMVGVVLDANLKANKVGCVVRGICCTGTTTSIVALRGRNLVSSIPAIRWDDQRATVEAASLENVRQDTKHLGDSITELPPDRGAIPWMSFGADSAPARAIWLATRYAEHLTAETSVLEQIDLVTFFWTGKRVLSESIASRKWGLTESRRWPSEFHQSVSGLFHGYLDAMLPKLLVEAATSVGRVLSSHAETYGLPPNTQVIAAPYDTVAQILGLGLLNEDAAVAVSLGTSMGVCSLVRDVSKVGFSPYGPIPDIPFRGYGLLYDGLRSCGSAIDLVCAMALGPKVDGPAYYERISRCLQETEPGADGVVVVPYFSGGLRSTAGGVPIIRGFHDTKQRHLVRAVFEAIAYHIRLIIENFEVAVGSKLQKVLTGGGPSRSAEFMQIIADVTDREIRVTKYADSGLLGCAVCAAAGLAWYSTPVEASRALTTDAEVFHPRPQYVQTYDDLYQKYRGYLSANADRSQEIHHAS